MTIKVCPECMGNDFIVENGVFTCNECDCTGPESDLRSVPGEITIEQIERGMKNGLVEVDFVDDCRLGVMGLACRVGDDIFYFENFPDGEPESLEDYYENYCPREKVAEHIHNCIGTPEQWDASGDDFTEWMYMMSLLTDPKYSSMDKKEL